MSSNSGLPRRLAENLLNTQAVCRWTTSCMKTVNFKLVLPRKNGIIGTEVAWVSLEEDCINNYLLKSDLNCVHTNCCQRVKFSLHPDKRVTTKRFPFSVAFGGVVFLYQWGSYKYGTRGFVRLYYNLNFLQWYDTNLSL